MYMVKETDSFERSEMLIDFSKKYAHVLPQFSLDSATKELESLVNPRLVTQVQLAKVQRVRPIQALAPYQTPPKKYIHWKTWKRLSHSGPKGWEVLSFFAHGSTFFNDSFSLS